MSCLDSIRALPVRQRKSRNPNTAATRVYTHMSLCRVKPDLSLSRSFIFPIMPVAQGSGFSWAGLKVETKGVLWVQEDILVQGSES